MTLRTLKTTLSDAAALLAALALFLAAAALMGVLVAP